MNTKFPWVAILVASALTVACGEDDDDKDDDGGSSDGGSADGGSGDGGSSDGGSGDGGSGDGGGGGSENPYTSYDGWESLDYAGGGLPAGEYNCQIVWRFNSSSPINPMDSSCDNCVFMFEDVEYVVDTEYTTHDGTCEGVKGWVGSYGYSDDFEGYGASWVYNYGGAYYWWGYGAFDGATFNYVYGYVDYPYNGTYYTYYQYGLVDVL